MKVFRPQIALVLPQILLWGSINEIMAGLDMAPIDCRPAGTRTRFSKTQFTIAESRTSVILLQTEVLGSRERDFYHNSNLLFIKATWVQAGRGRTIEWPRVVWLNVTSGLWFQVTASPE